MGYMRHHAIVVSSCDDRLIEAAHKEAAAIGLDVTNIVGPVVNGYRSFCVVPDGSKEGWSASDEGDANRAAFIEWCREQAFDDGSSLLEWVEVQFADDYLETAVLADSDEARRQFSPQGE